MSFVHLKHLQPWKSRVDNFLTRGNTKEKGIRMVSRKKWLILAFLNKKRSVNRLLPGHRERQEKLAQSYWCLPCKSRLPFPRRHLIRETNIRAESFCFRKSRILSFHGDFSNTCRTARYPDAGYWAARAWDAPSNE